MTNLTRIYTRIGDAGNTRLSDNAEVSKTDLWVEAYGAVDKTNPNLALAVVHGGLPERVVEMLALIRNELFDVGADPSTPLYLSPQYPPLRVGRPSIDRLEEWCDELGVEPPFLCSLIPPGGSPVVAQLHVTRMVCRRVKRVAWRATQIRGTEPSVKRGEGGVNLPVIIYLSRLSNPLFNICRTTAGPEGDVLQVPGAGCQLPEKRRSRTKK